MVLPKKAPKQYIFIQPTFELTKDDKYRVALICVNNQLKKLVQIVLETLQNLNSDKKNELLKILKNPDEIHAVLRKPNIKDFVESIVNSSVFSSESSFTFFICLAVELNNASENKFKKQIKAKTIHASPELGFDNIVETVRKNLFAAKKVQNKVNASNGTSEIETLVTSLSKYNGSTKPEKIEKDSSFSDNTVNKCQNTSFNSIKIQLQQNQPVKNIVSSSKNSVKSKTLNRRKIVTKKSNITDVNRTSSSHSSTDSEVINQ